MNLWENAPRDARYLLKRGNISRWKMVEMASAARLLPATFAGAGNLAFLFALAWGVACAENLALPKDAAVLDNWHGCFVVCLILIFGTCLHLVGLALSASFTVA